MLESVLAYLNNWFISESLNGTFRVEGGLLKSELPQGFLSEGQYFRVVGSVFNDGLHKAGDTDLTDETFTGTLYSLKIPPALVELTEQISEWCEKYLEHSQTPYTSESFGGYSYSKASDGESTWQGAFSKQLSRWRKI